MGLAEILEECMRKCIHPNPNPNPDPISNWRD